MNGVLGGARRRLAIVAAVVHVVIGAVTGGASTAHAAVVDAAPLTAMTFNIRYDTERDGANAWPHRREQVVELLRDVDADVVGVQEALHGQRTALAAALPEYTVLGVGRDDGRTAGEACPLLIRSSRFDVLDSGTFWLSETPAVPGSTSYGNTLPRICTWARLRDRTAPAGADRWRVLNTHFDHASEPARRAAAAQLRTHVEAATGAGERVIVLGDLNAGPGTETLRRLQAAAGPAALRDAWVEGRNRASKQAGDVDHAPPGTFHAFEGQGFLTDPGRRHDPDRWRIDHVLVGPRVRVAWCRIDRRQKGERCPSDHYPVVARLQAVPSMEAAPAEPDAVPDSPGAR